MAQLLYYAHVAIFFNACLYILQVSYGIVTFVQSRVDENDNLDLGAIEKLTVQQLRVKLR